MRLAWLLTLIVLSAKPAIANEVSIRSGEHDTYSRLVLTISEGAKWVIQRNELGYSLQVDGTTDFDKSKIYDRIPATRIASTQSQGDELQLIVNCACHATAFLWRPDKLVIDINDGARDNDFAEVDVESDVVLAPTLPIITPVSRQPAVIPLDAEVKHTNGLAELEQIVLESLALGASQGLLNPATLIEQVQSERFPTANLDAGLEAHTAIGRNQVHFAEVSADSKCLPDDFFKLREWGRDKEYSEAIATLRSGLVDELGEIQASMVSDLAKAYLHFGFGREAKAALSSVSEMSAERAVLEAIAAILDGDFSLADQFHDQHSCAGQSFFWAYLSESSPPASSEKTNNLLRTFRDLPTPVQMQIGPQLYNRLIDNGDHDGANLIAASIQAKGETTLDVALIELDLQASDEGFPEIAPKFETLINENPRLTADDLSDYFGRALAAGVEPSDEALDLADVLIFEENESQEAKDLVAAKVRAQLQLGDAKRAFESLKSHGSILEPDVLESLTAKAIAAATIEYSDAQFLEFSYLQVVSDVAPNVRADVASRLHEMGFPERAAFLSENNTSIYAKDDDFLTTNPRAQVDRVATPANDGASQQLARDDASSTEVESSGSNNLQIDVSEAELDDWRKGQWRQLSRSSDPLMREISNSMLQDGGLEESNDAPLAKGRKLLVESEEKRALLASVMDRFSAVEE